jgi:hypothetical protein
LIDTDGDNLSDFLETKHYESNPLDVDTDGDGLNDDVEVTLGTNLNDVDSDDDGLTDGNEDANTNGIYDIGTETNPLNSDTDGDGASDAAEDLNANGIVDEGETDPLDADSNPSSASLIAGTEDLQIIYAGEISAAESNEDVCAIDGCVLTLFVTASQASAAGINPFDIVWYHDVNEDQLIDVSPNSPEVLNGIPEPDTPETIVTLVPGTTDLYEVSATVFFNSKFAVGGVKALALGGLSVASGSGSGAKGGDYPYIDSFSLTSFGNLSDGFGGMLDPVDLNSIEDTLTFKTNEDLAFSFDLYENQGLNNIEHIGFYLNNKGPDLKTKDYDTSIVFDKYSSEELTLSDPNGLLDSYDFNIKEIDAYNFKITYYLTFSETFDASNFYITAWDSDKNPTYKTFEGILQISDSENLGDEAIYENKKTFENNEVFDDDSPSLTSLENIPTSHENPSDEIVEIPEPVVSLRQLLQKVQADAVIPTNTACGDESVLKNGICVIDIIKQESEKSDRISIIIGIFILEIILGTLIGVIFRTQRKQHLMVQK